MSFGGLGVAIFFGISGYLVTTSLQRSGGSIPRFLAKRGLRIFPALIAVTVLSAYLLGPLVTSLDLKTYFSSRITLAYVYNNVVLHSQFDLPGVFKQNPYPQSVNGSLWTLPIEVALYLVVAGFSFVRSKKVQQGLSFALAAAAAVAYYRIPEGKYIRYGCDLYQVFYHAPYFFVGSFLSYKAGWVRDHGPRLILPLCVGLLFLANTPLIRIASWIAIPCIAIFLGEKKSGRALLTTKLGDVSYGVYVWSFPMQQVAIQYLLPRIGPFPALLLAAITVLLLAKLSWQFIERPALSLKRPLST
jgi:peptidoglycan/LPS O-acetylase OafA/YrhL